MSTSSDSPERQENVSGMHCRTKLPNFGHDLNIAKGILQKCSENSGENVFDHLSEIIKRILNGTPENVIDYFEEFSRSIREEKLRSIHSRLPDLYDPPKNLARAKSILCSMGLSPYPSAHTRPEDEEETELADELDENTPHINSITDSVIHSQFYWQLCGFGMPKEVVYLLSFSIQKLQHHPVIKNCKFWGKIFGLKANYYIVEAELTRSEIIERNRKMKMEIEEKYPTTSQTTELYERLVSEAIIDDEMIPGLRWQGKDANTSMEKIQEHFLKLPKSTYKRPRELPPEYFGKGLNAKVYFVCTDLTKDWIELPIVTPKEILLSREIRKYFKGDLNAEIFSYPEFFNTEKHYLRATIARITHATSIAPKGFWKLTDNQNSDLRNTEDLVEFDSKQENKLVENVDYKLLPKTQITDQQFWVHTHSPILEEGRVSFLYPKTQDNKVEETSAEKNSAETEKASQRVETLSSKKIINANPVPLSSTCIKDHLEGLFSAWTTRSSSEFQTQNSAVIMSSNIWPGAYSIAYNRFCDSIYIGWGHKCIAKRNYSPPMLPDIENDYEISSDIKETDDTSAKIEEDWRENRLEDEDSYQETVYGDNVEEELSKMKDLQI